MQGRVQLGRRRGCWQQPHNEQVGVSERSMISGDPRATLWNTDTAKGVTRIRVNGQVHCDEMLSSLFLDRDMQDLSYYRGKWSLQMSKKNMDKETKGEN